MGMYECPKCGQRPTFTGVSRFIDGQTKYEFKCSCGEEGWMEEQSPGGPNQSCSYCGKMGHWRPDCPEKKK